MTARAAVLAALFVVAGSTLAVAGVEPVAAQPALGSDPPEETDDGATFTVSTQSIELHEGGTICAEKMAPDVNKLTITDATMNGVELYLGDDEQPKKVEAESADVDEIVLYTNGENQLVDLLATTGACIPLDQPQETVIEVYYQEAGTLAMNEFQMVTGGTDAPPEPGGLTLPDSILNESSTEDGPVDNVTDAANQTTAVVGNATDTVQETTDAVNETTGAVNETTGNVPGAVDRVDETTENVTETVDRVENPTETVDDTLETVDGTTDTVNETVGDPTGTVDGVDDSVDDTTDTVNDTTDTVDDTTDEVEDVTTAVEDTVGETGDTVTDPSDGPDDDVDQTGDAVEETGEAVENTTGDVEDTVDDTEETVQDSTDTATDPVEDTTTEVEETAEEVVPPTAGFGLGENVPLVGDPVALDASGSSDSDGEIATYEWDLDGDGNYEKTGESVTHAFSEPGEREVTLRVTDDDGATDTATETVRVNAPPNAAFSIVSDLLTIGEPIDLDATGSSDPDGEIATYEWDVDGDGDFEESGATPSPTFTDLGVQEITLRVTDDDGATDTATETIDLTDDDGGLLGGGDSTADGDDGSTDDGDDTSIIGAILP